MRSFTLQALQESIFFASAEISLCSCLVILMSHLYCSLLKMCVYVYLYTPSFRDLSLPVFRKNGTPLLLSKFSQLNVRTFFYSSCCVWNGCKIILHVHVNAIFPRLIIMDHSNLDFQQNMQMFGIHFLLLLGQQYYKVDWWFPSDVLIIIIIKLYCQIQRALHDKLECSLA